MVDCRFAQSARVAKLNWKNKRAKNDCVNETPSKFRPVNARNHVVAGRDSISRLDTTPRLSCIALLSRPDMDELKWPLIAFACIAVAWAIADSFTSYSSAIENRAAMENGYEQVETKSGRILWRPCDTR